MILMTFCVEARLRWNKRKRQEKSRLEDYYSGSEERWLAQTKVVVVEVMRRLVKWLDLGCILEIDPSKLSSESDDNATRRTMLPLTEVEEVIR